MPSMGPTNRARFSIVLKEGPDLWSLLKVEKRDDDVYFYHPKLGVHFSAHASGETHFTSDYIRGGTIESPCVLLQLPGLVVSRAGGREVIMRPSVRGLREAEKLYFQGCLITSPVGDFAPYRPKGNEESFVIDKSGLDKDTAFIGLAVWAVPSGRDFRFNYHPDARRCLVFKFANCEPQIWIEVIA